jgi:hypothetical protein
MREFQSLQAREALHEAGLPVAGLAVVADTYDGADAPHSYIKCGDIIVRIHWGVKAPGMRTIMKAAAIVAVHCVPPIGNGEYEILEA